MIITSNVIKSNFIVMFFTFLIYEVILMTCLVLLYYQQIKKVNSNIEKQIIENNSEVMLSFNSFLSEELKSICNDLELIVTHLSALTNGEDLGRINTQSLFAQSYLNCIIIGLDSLLDTKYTAMFDIGFIKNPIQAILCTYFDKGIASYSNSEIINILSNIPSLSYLSSIKLQADDSELCFIQIILKAILIKSIVLWKDKPHLNNIFIFTSDNTIVYPPNKVSQKDFLKQFPVFQCKDDYSSQCLYDRLKQLFENNLPYHQIIDDDLSVWTCMKRELSSKSYFICLQNDLQRVYNSIHMPNSLSVLATIQYDPSKENNTMIRVLGSPNHSNMTYFDSEYLGVYNNTYELQLFHLLYSEIFKEKHSNLTENDIKGLITQYESIALQITQTKTTTPSNFSIEQTFLDYDYNINGKLDKVNGWLKHDIFVYYITPLQDSKGETLPIEPKENTIRNIAIYKMIINNRNKKLYEILIYKCIRSWTFFAFLLLICSLPYLLFFRCLLRQTFAPIEEIAQKMEMKFSSVSTRKGVLQRSTKLTIDEYEGLNEEYKDFCQFFFFLENLLIMKQGNSNNLQINESIMNKIYPYLQSNKPKITYGAYVARYFYQNQMHLECKSTIQNIKPILDEELNRIKEETDNIEIRLNNLFSKYPYINDFSQLDRIFNEECNSQAREYFDLCLISSQLYFIYGMSKYMSVYLPIKQYKAKQKHKKEGKLLYKPEEDKQKTTYNDVEVTHSSRQLKAFQENQLKIKENSAKAIVYFKRSLVFNKKFNCNKIKSILLHVYIAQCFITQVNHNEAFANLKEALVFFLEFNDELIEMEERHKIKFDSAIMMIINSLLFEEIIYLISKVFYSSKDKSNETLIVKHLSQVMSLSVFKTDFVQAKVCKLLSKIIESRLFVKDSSENSISLFNPNDDLQIIANQIQLMKKIETRLKQSSADSLRRKIVIIISPGLVERLPSIIEFGEIIGSCIKNYCSGRDLIWCFQFNSKEKIKARTVEKFSKENIYKVLLNKTDECDFGMQQGLQRSIEIFKESEDWEDFDCIEDNYVFQFILSADYKYESAEKRISCRNEINENNISLYTFIFDFNLAKVKKKQGIISDNNKYFEGVIFAVKNFDIIKSAFQNISHKKSKKNLFNFDLDISQNVFYFIHLLTK